MFSTLNIYKARNFPEGLRCIDCDGMISEGFYVSRPLEEDVNEIVCVKCGTK